MTGMRFGRLIVLHESGRRYTPTGQSVIMWLCRCDCGTELTAIGANIRNGVTKSCGCLKQERATIAELNPNYRHGGANNPAYLSWYDMIARCTRPAHPMWKNYGGRGITVCEPWRASFQQFLADMGERPDKLTIERADNNGNYEPSNCHWATRLEQGRNTRRCVRTTELDQSVLRLRNQGYTYAAIAQQLGISKTTVNTIIGESRKQ